MSSPYREHVPAVVVDDPLARLEARIAAMAAAGHTNPWGAAASIACAAPPLEASALTVLGWYRSATDAVSIAPLRCGAETGIVGVVATGNYKDEATVVASAIVVDAFDVELGESLPAVCDVGPALRRAVLRAQDDIVSISSTRVAPDRFGTAGGLRRDMRGIGASVAAVVALPGAAWLTSVGECSSWLVRDGIGRRLNLIDTLANAKGYRDGVARDPTRRIEGADDIVTRVLGMNPAVDPDVVVTRVDVLPGDRIVVGSEWFTKHLAGVEVPPSRSPAQLCDHLVEAADPERSPPGGILAIAR